jgi:hypothetical protein
MQKPRKTKAQRTNNSPEAVATPVISDDATETKSTASSRSWFCVWNNPQDTYSGEPAEIAEQALADWIADHPTRTGAVAYCISADGLVHLHMVLEDSSKSRFSAVKTTYPKAHIEPTQGRKEEAENYIQKRGKFAEKGEVVVYIARHGEIQGRQGQRSDIAHIVQMIEDGIPNKQIRQLYPAQYFLHQSKIERIRQEIRQELAAGECRPLVVKYIYGTSGTGKTRYINDTYGATAFRVTDYSHPFDGYNGQDILVFEEFHSQITMSGMLDYLDVYCTELPSRYANKIAVYSKVYIISNLSLEQQYQNIQKDEPQVWAAFARRIHSVIHFKRDGTKLEMPTAEYLANPQLLCNMPTLRDYMLARRREDAAENQKTTKETPLPDLQNA